MASQVNFPKYLREKIYIKKKKAAKKRKTIKNFKKSYIKPFIEWENRALFNSFHEAISLTPKPVKNVTRKEE